MNSKRNFIINLIKTSIRVVGAIITLMSGSIIPLAIGVVVSEIVIFSNGLYDEKYSEN